MLRRLSQRRWIAPNVFHDRLLAEAKSKKKRIVLPEGEDTRILLAASEVEKRGIAEVLVLGNEQEIGRVLKSENIQNVNILDPTNAREQCLKYAEDVYARRKDRGMSLEAAYELMQSDFPSFAAMMVAAGDMDGMVSGSTHTSADTIRSALQLIGTSEDQSTVSSLFFMLLGERVMVFSDCALQVSPDPKQLAEIASSSAKTASAFGVSPNVAFLSYATGDSNSGPKVSLVEEAVTHAKGKVHDFPISGPLQYDAAVSPRVAKAKKADTDGESTILIFPDLNCGNITYKAVQQATGCIAMGPILQGLKRPVNDLSRGCTIEDIISTVAVTAVQAKQSVLAV